MREALGISLGTTVPKVLGLHPNATNCLHPMLGRASSQYPTTLLISFISAQVLHHLTSCNAWDKCGFNICDCGFKNLINA